MSSTRLLLVPPKRALLLSTLILFGLVALCVWAMWNMPWMGMRLAPAASGDMLIQAVAGPAEQAGLQAAEEKRPHVTIADHMGAEPGVVQSHSGVVGRRRYVGNVAVRSAKGGLQHRP